MWKGNCVGGGQQFGYWEAEGDGGQGGRWWSWVLLKWQQAESKQRKNTGAQLYQAGGLRLKCEDNRCRVRGGGGRTENERERAPAGAAAEAVCVVEVDEVRLDANAGRAAANAARRCRQGEGRVVVGLVWKVVEGHRQLLERAREHNLDALCHSLCTRRSAVLICENSCFMSCGSISMLSQKSSRCIILLPLR